MIIICPNCSTRFSLPDAQVRPGIRLRCSVCKHVFPLPKGSAPQVQPLEGDSLGGPDLRAPVSSEDRLTIPEKKPSHWLRNILLFLLVCALLCGAGLWYLKGGSELLDALGIQRTGFLKEIALADARHFPVSNEKVGQLTIIEGKLVNKAREPVERIQVEASLLDKNKRVLVSKRQMAGNTVPLFQLQVGSEAELEQALNNNLGLLSNNTNVAPGGTVPFMVIFSNPPQEAAEYSVKVVDARRPSDR